MTLIQHRNKVVCPVGIARDNYEINVKPTLIQRIVTAGRLSLQQHLSRHLLPYDIPGFDMSSKLFYKTAERST